MIYILFDKIKSSKSFISKGLGPSCLDFYSPSKKSKYSRWIWGCIKVLEHSKKNDTIVCWFDFQGILCFWICNLFFIKRNIICLNILLKDKHTFKNKTTSWLYKIALLSPKVKASITSLEYGLWLNQKLGINIKYTLIHDVYHDTYEYTNHVNSETKKSVFCGGRNGRDWEFMIKVAKTLPNTEFNMIMPKDAYLKYSKSFTPNIHARYEVSYNEFMKTLCASSLVCLPLDTEAPAGLIVMFQAAANHKMVITTKTATTIEYINEERGKLLEKSIKDWSIAVKYYLSNDAERNSKADRLCSYLKDKCSKEKFVNGVKSMLTC